MYSENSDEEKLLPLPTSHIRNLYKLMHSDVQIFVSNIRVEVYIKGSWEFYKQDTDVYKLMKKPNNS